MKLNTCLRSWSCWLAVTMALWSLSYYYISGTKEGGQWIIEDLAAPLVSEFDIGYRHGTRLIMLISPMLFVSALCHLMITDAPLKNRLQIRINAFFARYRGFEYKEDGIEKKNQFGLGELSYNYLAIFLVTMPVIFFFILTLDNVLGGEEVSGEDKWKAISNASALAGTLALSFFLIPVTRHSILLVAMGWNPIQALRVHIWAGFTSFFFIFFHGMIYFVLWFRNDQERSVRDQVWPGAGCWDWKRDTPSPRSCRTQWYNLTGIAAFFFLLVLVVTSLNWFRRHYYKQFYVFHMVCGFGFLGMAIMHWRPIITFLAPSIIYYLASTMPAFVQAISSRVRGGVRILQVVHIPDAGGVKEVHIATTPEANRVLETSPSMYVKLAAPSISLVSHPFTVFKHPRDPTTVRVLMRPVGPFTKALIKRWEKVEPTPVVVDGFIQTGNRCHEALQHDHVAILCGGVAITPFLTLIPCILHAISERLRKGEELITKKMVLYWSCREAGLCDYVLDNYLKGMKLAADAMGFDFEIIVHRTGKKTRRATLDPIKCCRHIKLATNIMNLEDGSGPLDFKANGNLENNTSPLDSTFVAHDLSIEVDEVIDIDEQNDAEEEKRRSSSSSSSSGDSDRELPTNEDPQTKNSTSKAEISKGDKATNADPSFTPKKDHLMELHHFMPAKHSRVLENLPCFLALGGSMWIFFYIIFYFYRSYEVRAHEGADRLWPVFVCILVSIGLSVFFEGCPLMAKLLKKDGSVNPEPCKCRPEYLPVDDENGSAVVIDYRQGRANMCEIFEFADKAECPAIFMCGPPAMTKLVREKARQENSVFGLTRFVIYEDPFEM